MQKFGVHSEVGKLRTVLVCRPGLAHQRLTPGNAAGLLFDDVLWVQEAQNRQASARLAGRIDGNAIDDHAPLLPIVE